MRTRPIPPLIACALLLLFQVLACGGVGIAAGEASASPACRRAQIRFTTDDEYGAFAGMSHNGTLLQVHNMSRTICSLAALPEITFRAADGTPLRVERDMPTATVDVHGPTRVPALIASGRSAYATLRWVAANVYADGRCVTPASVALRSHSGETLVASLFRARLCGPRSGQTFTATPFSLAKPRL